MSKFSLIIKKGLKMKKLIIIFAAIIFFGLTFFLVKPALAQIPPPGLHYWLYGGTPQVGEHSRKYHVVVTWDENGTNKTVEYHGVLNDLQP